MNAALIPANLAAQALSASVATVNPIIALPRRRLSGPGWNGQESPRAEMGSGIRRQGAVSKYFSKPA